MPTIAHTITASTTAVHAGMPAAIISGMVNTSVYPPHHDEIPVGEVDQPDDAIHHRVPERDQRVDKPHAQSVDQLLNE